MQLFIIGNGFDRAHDLPTTYWDFRTYLQQMYPEFLYSFEEEYYIYPSGGDEAKKSMLWNDLETNLANINEEVIIEQAVSIDMGLEGGDVGIEDTFYYYLTDKYKYIALLAKYMKQWVRTIRIRDLPIKTSLINSSNDALYITFNYTAVLERVYGIDVDRVIHIHGSLRQRDGDPVLGHGNKDRIEGIREKRYEAENLFSEKEISICRVIEDYYNHTYKNISRYMPKLRLLSGENVGEISVIGHSLAGVDIPYFRIIDELTQNTAKWKVYYRNCEDEERMKNSLSECGIDIKRIEMLHSQKFFDL